MLSDITTVGSVDPYRPLIRRTRRETGSRSAPRAGHAVEPCGQITRSPVGQVSSPKAWWRLASCRRSAAASQGPRCGRSRARRAGVSCGEPLGRPRKLSELRAPRRLPQEVPLAASSHSVSVPPVTTPPVARSGILPQCGQINPSTPGSGSPPHPPFPISPCAANAASYVPSAVCALPPVPGRAPPGPPLIRPYSQGISIGWESSLNIDELQRTLYTGCGPQIPDSRLLGLSH